ncbi:glycosyltransferase family 39 protein [Candidatus Sumerlaeota bacterium]|nr:glycosyltransferase family 39 protein [Candidatus Sumerlaeota bacterium]
MGKSEDTASARPIRSWLRRNRFALLFSTAIGLVAAWLRFKALGFQSLWFDELLTLHYSSWRFSVWETVYYCAVQEHTPPLLYLIAKAWQSVSTPGEFSARIPFAVFGVSGVVAMFFLGREAFSRRVGVYAAILCAFLPFHIRYSQEARAYSLVFLFTVLSYTFLARLVRTGSRRDGWCFALSAAPMLYSHYFGLMVVASQLVFAGFLFTSRTSRPEPRTIENVVLAFFLAAILYSPWMPALVRIAEIDDFWIRRPRPDFFIDYFKQYMGKEPYLVVGYALLIASYLVGAGKAEARLRDHRLMLFSWVFVALAIPYVRSFVAQPSLISRYSIVIVPALILMASQGIAAMARPAFRRFVLVTLVVMSLVNLFFTDEGYYHRIAKEPYREIAQWVIKQDPEAKYPVFTDPAFAYYLEDVHHANFVIRPPVRYMEGARLCYRTIVSSERKGGWVLRGHFAMAPEAREYLDTRLRAVKDKRMRRTRSTLYVYDPTYEPDAKAIEPKTEEEQVPQGDIEDEGEPFRRSRP